MWAELFTVKNASTRASISIQIKLVIKEEKETCDVSFCKSGGWAHAIAIENTKSAAIWRLKRSVEDLESSHSGDQRTALEGLGLDDAEEAMGAIFPEECEEQGRRVTCLAGTREHQKRSTA